MRRLSLMLPFALLAACALGPDYARPAVELPAAYSETAGWAPVDVAAPAAPAGEWWQAYGDATLADLVPRIALANQDLAAAFARQRQAEAALGVARAGLWPTVGVDLQVTRSRGAQNRGNAVTARSDSAATLARLAGSASWELDLWGRVRRGVEQAEANHAASAADLAATELSLRADLVSTYLALRVSEAERRLLDARVLALVRARDITRNRYRAGVAPKLDLSQAETQLASLRAQAVDLAQQQATLRHALATLVGVVPGALELAASEAPPNVPAAPPAVPATLLQRRPDIAAAERRMAAANAAIGVAVAAWYPTLSLGASAGFQHSNVIDLVSLPFNFWSVGPALAGTLFDGGLRRGQSERARAAYDETVATYRQTVLVAMREVEDQLATLGVLAEETRHAEDAVASAREAESLALNQYKAGTVDYLTVVSAQTAALDAERTLLGLRGRRLAASVELFKALGGAP